LLAGFWIDRQPALARVSLARDRRAIRPPSGKERIDLLR
jgi:hypothetical protein